MFRSAADRSAHGIQFFTSIEDPSRVILMIEWDIVEAHTQHRGTPVHNGMREMTARYQTRRSLSTPSGPRIGFISPVQSKFLTSLDDIA